MRVVQRHAKKGKTQKNTAQMRHSCTISSRKPPEKLIRQHLFPLSIFDLIITHKLTRPIQKQKLRGKEKRNRKEGRKQMQTWAQQEVGHAQFGDRRLSKRLVRIVTDLSDHPEASVPQASGDWAATKGV